MNKVVIKKSASKSLAKLQPKGQRDQVQAFIDSLSENARPIGSKKLEGQEDAYRKRVGDYRIVWTVDSNQVPTVITVTKIGPRGDIYKGKGK